MRTAAEAAAGFALVALPVVCIVRVGWVGLLTVPVAVGVLWLLLRAEDTALGDGMMLRRPPADPLATYRGGAPPAECPRHPFARS